VAYDRIDLERKDGDHLDCTATGRPEPPEPFAVFHNQLDLALPACVRLLNKAQVLRRFRLASVGRSGAGPDVLRKSLGHLDLGRFLFVGIFLYLLLGQPPAAAAWAAKFCIKAHASSRKSNDQPTHLIPPLVTVSRQYCMICAGGAITT